MSILAGALTLGGACFLVWVAVHLAIVSRPPRGNRCSRSGKNVLPPPSPACERYSRLAER